jgi:hypothetical protein
MLDEIRLKLKSRVEKIYSDSAYTDMINHKKTLSKAKQKNYKGGYCLSDTTIEAKEMYSIISKTSELITFEEEEIVKGYLLKNLLFSQLKEIK